MPTFGRLTNSLLAANNENTLALANLNFDFTLIKFEAPKEFHPFGQSLSVQRRSEAEEGTTHKIARRLGALFEGLVPQTPELIKAYGRRTSEIATKPHINPRGTKRDGPFEAYVGADGTSLWAAVTSINNDTTSHPPLVVHLLACILARAYEAKIAVAIWVELVRARREEIESCIDRAPQPLSACMAAGQDISRDQLALWDDSARSWLRSADEANKANRTRLQLLVNNMHLTFTHHKTTYQSVISIWQNAMQGMEQAIKGNPQAVSDGSVLMA
ncbi:hypothetical protein PMZ80_007110 [Knufia obscura]|uniref:Uncharacterized protein n=1 Tax=Knufia obscura TaxID=1635080 RepID=A0ABR0RJ99_9EURO|nr:hypothetical protein PMZ80_007110 [Knufia obscura]